MDNKKYLEELRLLGEEVQQLEEKNCPTNPSKWSYYKSQAKQKFDVYPSAYANGWASKQYKAAGGGWKQCTGESVNEAYVIFYAKKKGDKPSQAAYRDKDMALKFEKDLKKDGYITMMVNKKIKGVDESVNEGIEPQIKKIAYYTGTRPEAVEDFVSKHGLNITKLLKFVEKGKLPERMAIVSALAGKPGNPVQKKIIKQFSESINEDYYKSASDAADAARKYAEKKGFEIDEDDWQTQIAMGGKHNRLRPGVGKTHSFSVGLTKNGKPQRKALNISLYGMDSGKFELTSYIN